MNTGLGTGHIDIYRPAHLDPQVPIEETVGAIAEIVRAGYVTVAQLAIAWVPSRAEDVVALVNANASMRRLGQAGSN